MAVAALVCGILGVAGSFVTIPIVSAFTLVFSVVAIVLGATARKNPTQSRNMATAGMVLGIIGTVFSVSAIICVICVVGAVGSLASLTF